MARINDDGLNGQADSSNSHSLTIDVSGQSIIEVPNSEFISDSTIMREGQDLVLETANGENLILENYFLADPAPQIESPDGSVLTSNLVQSFLSSPAEYAQASSMSDVSPIGAVEELSGEASVVRADGTTETLTLGSPIYEGDTIQTSESGAVNVMFIDETSMAVSENARLSVDDYQFDPQTESGSTNLSVLRGVFVFTSGLIGRDDPDDVLIDTPVGSIGIRGTIIAGKILPGADSEITVVEGAIVVKNAIAEKTLSIQYESLRLGGFNDDMIEIGVKAAKDVGKTYGSVKDVVPKLFSSIHDSEREENNSKDAADDKKEEGETEEALEETDQQASADEVNEDSGEENTLQDPVELKQLSNLIDVLEKHLDQKDLKDTAQSNRFKGIEKTLAKNIDQLDIDDLPPRVAEELQVNDLELFVDNERLFEGSETGDTVGNISVTTSHTGMVTFTFEDGSSISPDGFFEIVQNDTQTAEIVLTTAGETAMATANVDSPLATGQGYTIVATSAFGTDRVIITTPPNVLDAAVYIDPGHNGLDYDVSNEGVVPPNFEIGDYDGDGDVDFGTIDANQDAFILDDINNPASILESDSSKDFDNITNIGDTDNDGFIDIVLGSSTDTVSAVGDAGSVKVRDSNGSLTIGNPTPEAGGDHFGNAVAAAGDFNGDGFDDFIVGAVDNNNNGASQTGGSAFIFTENNTSAASFTQIRGIPLSLPDSNLDFGYAVHGVGDINADGLSDVMIQSNEGVSIIFGSATNYQEDSNNLSVSQGSTFPGSYSAAAAAGDVNGDGYDDIAFTYVDGTTVTTLVVYGTTAGGVINVDDPANALKIIDYDVTNPSTYTIQSVGDWDGDGFDDIRIGEAAGDQYIVFGQAAGDAEFVFDADAADGAGTPGTEDGQVAATADDQALVGDVDFDDNMHNGISMRGGAGDNKFLISNDTFLNIDGGSGTDSINVNSGVDFSAINYEQISQIEKVQLTQDSASITLTAENIFNMLKSSDDGTLTIELGSTASSASLNIDASTDYSDDTTGVVNALNEHVSGATHVETAGGYDHYQIGNFDLYIDTDVTTAVV